ncbi:MAG: hypothetical protein LBJ47_03645 [Tannerella sp.]|jgi:hypothetical protein|nr:hypothetical protein [Tannerella sp.]
MNKNIILTSAFFALLFISVSAFSQTLTPRFGLEIAGSAKKVDAASAYNSPAFSGYIGFYTQVPLKSDRLFARFGAGLNLTPVRRNEMKGFFDETGSYQDLYASTSENSVLSGLSVSAELRYYLLPGFPFWGNLYAVLPVTLESEPFAKWIAPRSELKVIPGIGYRYEFCKHWGIEAGAGIGWGRYFTPKEVNMKKSALEYTASLRVGYAF